MLEVCIGVSDEDFYACRMVTNTGHGLGYEHVSMLYVEWLLILCYEHLSTFFLPQLQCTLNLLGIIA